VDVSVTGCAKADNMRLYEVYRKPVLRIERCGMPGAIGDARLESERKMRIAKEREKKT
jgi:hypothetical protein